MPFQSTIAAEVVDRHLDEHGQPVEQTRIVRFDTPAHFAICEWMQAHDIDPKRVLAGRVVRDAVQYRIRYTLIAVDEHGRKRVTPREDGDLEVLTSEAFEQGEAPPLPLPPEVLAIAPKTIGLRS